MLDFKAFGFRKLIEKIAQIVVGLMPIGLGSFYETVDPRRGMCTQRRIREQPVLSFMLSSA
jgi:hypothetical protein